MTVLVTGATGFVGTHLCEYLEVKDFSFRKAVRRNVDGDEQAIVVGDIDGQTDWSQALDGIEVVVHLAARVHIMLESAKDPFVEFRRVNVDGSLNLARQAAAKGIKRIVYLSTIKVNGEGTVGRPYRPDDIPAPADPYSVSKMEAEEGLLRIARETGMEVVILRPPLIYGKGAGGNLFRLLKLVKQGWYLPFGLINNKRSLIGIENLCSIIVVSLSHPAAVNRVMLVSDGEDVSTPELIRLLAQGCGRSPRIFPVPLSVLYFMGKLFGRTSEIHRLSGDLQVDSSQTQSLLDWCPILSLAQGIQNCSNSSE